MSYELISAEDFENLPDEPDQKFVEIDRICRANLNKMINDDTSAAFDAMIRVQYMTTLAAAADELGIPNIVFPYGEADPASRVADFMFAVSGAATRIRLRTSGKSAPYSVRLGVRTKGRIELQIQRLRTIVIEADIPEAKRKALLEKLDELSSELRESRLSFAKTMRILALIGVGLGGCTAFLADAPQAISTIASLIGADKEVEEAEVKRLGGGVERKLLPGPSDPPSLPQSSLDTARANFRSSFDDWDSEVPF